MSLQLIWSSIFLLPKSFINNIESLLAAFLWTGDSKHYGAKVACNDLRKPLTEGWSWLSTATGLE